MQFLGSVRIDGSKRATLIKEVAEILEVSGQDYLDFFIDNGEIVIRKVLPTRGALNINHADFWEWARKRQIEIDMMDDRDYAATQQADLDSKTDGMKDIEEEIQKHLKE